MCAVCVVSAVYALYDVGDVCDVSAACAVYDICAVCGVCAVCALCDIYIHIYAACDILWVCCMPCMRCMCAKVELDDSGNRKAADVSFWLMEAVTFDGVSYLSGTEAARYACATGKVEVR